MTKAWEKHKVLLHRLYITEKKGLKRVMEIMEKKHNFVACRRTYMKNLGRWGYQKNRKSRAVRRESGPSGGVNTQPPSGAELIIWETDRNAPTYKINGEGITHRTEVLLQESATTEVTVEPVASYQATSGVSSPLDEFRDSNDLCWYLGFIEGALLLNQIKKNALLSGNPDPHFPAMSDYQQALGEIFFDQTPTV
ncbi:Clr5 domain-domain-containing protein [Tuber borchii]|uniref:Clr5 domain-domain-containing protein n=1 Tax=Tuber borchii TaxID=42251 RepID=A0A2T6ZUT4_TUBBO|nr:Clr5 domain-domain-containing protein [Tuber borchii]